MVAIKFYRWRSVPRGFEIQEVLPSQAAPEQFDLWPTREGRSEPIQTSSFDILTHSPQKDTWMLNQTLLQLTFNAYADCLLG